MVIPRKAATLLLLRPGEAGPEVLMMERHAGASFAPGMLVFPGGSVDAADEPDVMGPVARGLEGLPPEQATARVAAIREAFEEAGILLARKIGSAEVVGGADHDALRDRYQDAVAHHEIGFARMLAAEGLELAADLLVRYAHWITPEGQPKRFDTQFYLAPAPADQTHLHDGREMVHAVWHHPLEAIRGEEAGICRLMVVTRTNLWRLAESATVEDALTAARASKIVTVAGRREMTEQGEVVHIPAEAGYGVTAVHVDVGPAGKERGKS